MCKSWSQSTTSTTVSTGIWSIFWWENVHHSAKAKVQDLMVRRKALLCFWCTGLDLWSWLGGFAIRNWHCAIKTLCLVVLTILKNMKVNGKDYPIYYGKWKMFETTNQIQNVEVDMITNQCRWFHWTFGFDSTMKRKVICGATTRWETALISRGRSQEILGFGVTMGYLYP